MNNRENPFVTILIFLLVLLVAYIAVAKDFSPVNFVAPERPAESVGGGQGVNRFTSFASSTAITVTTASTFVTATNTASTYRRLSNLGAAAVYCNVKDGAAASLNTGLVIYASSTIEMTVDNNPYQGAIHCIASQSNTVTFLEI